MRTVGRFQNFVHSAAAQGRLVVQPRMGVSDPLRMREGLMAVRNATATTVGTVTVDSYTRVNDHEAARRALDSGTGLNGFPIVAHGAQGTRVLLEGIADETFPVQVRHGSARPEELFETLIEAGVDATEGGPVSYCLPYSRVRLAEAEKAWRRSVSLAASSDRDLHIETFGGCMLGQLCPPGLLIALSVLEALYFAEHGIRSVSVSYAQQTHPGQDVAAVLALRRLASELLRDIDWHTVVYTFMGVYPYTEIGAFCLLEDSARLAVAGGAERLIVKTPAEAHRIPTFAENVSALEFAGAVAAFTEPGSLEADDPDPLYEEAARLVSTALAGADSVGDALVSAFDRGLLDIPYCLHEDNANRARAGIDPSGRLQWSDTGRMPVEAAAGERSPVGAVRLLEMLDHNRDRFDRMAITGMPRRSL